MLQFIYFFFSVYFFSFLLPCCSFLLHVSVFPKKKMLYKNNRSSKQMTRRLWMSLVKHCGFAVLCFEKWCNSGTPTWVLPSLPSFPFDENLEWFLRLPQFFKVSLPKHAVSKWLKWTISWNTTESWWLCCHLFRNMCCQISLQPPNRFQWDCSVFYGCSHVIFLSSLLLVWVMIPMYDNTISLTVNTIEYPQVLSLNHLVAWT